MITVVAALIEHQGKLLACQRKPGYRFELMWEFPGGKVEPGESPREALIRELHEELAVDARIGEEVYRTRHQYPAMPEAFELIFFSATAEPSAIKNLVFGRVEWRTPASLAELDFLPADRELIERLATGTLRLPAESTPIPPK
jgi:8-oxo-dGTP diphosphatase